MHSTVHILHAARCGARQACCPSGLGCLQGGCGAPPNAAKQQVACREGSAQLPGENRCGCPCHSAYCNVCTPGTR